MSRNSLSSSGLLVDTSQKNLTQDSDFRILNFDIYFKYNSESNEFDLENRQLLFHPAKPLHLLALPLVEKAHLLI